MTRLDALPPENVPARREAKAMRLEDLDRLFGVLRGEGYRLLGPRLRDAAIVYDELQRVEDLPIGWTDEQSPAHYRMKRRDDAACFGYAVGPHSWKKYLHPPTVRLFQAERAGGRLRILEDETSAGPPERVALIGARACELAAIEVQDGVLARGAFVDPGYRARREALFVVAVSCGAPAATCFCTSMGTGPRARTGFDLALTEIHPEDERHQFVVEVGSERGAAVLEGLGLPLAEEAALSAAEASLARAAESMTRSLDTRGIRDLLVNSPEHPRWDDVAGRCLTCGNCTMVCPTCFCTTVEDTSSLDGQLVERTRQWDSCFTLSFSHVHGGSVRTSVKGRYRQWMTHKLATWYDQFGTSGCVGCGRCITWCPTGIDITEEARAIRADRGDRSARPAASEQESEGEG